MKKIDLRELVHLIGSEIGKYRAIPSGTKRTIRAEDLHRFDERNRCNLSDYFIAFHDHILVFSDLAEARACASANNRPYELMSNFMMEVEWMDKATALQRRAVERPVTSVIL